MSGRALRAAGVAGGALVLLSGCGLAGGHARHDPGPSAVAPSAAPPVGSIEHPRPVTCLDGFTPGASPNHTGDGAHNDSGSSAGATPTPEAPASDPPSAPARTSSTSPASPSSTAASAPPSGRATPSRSGTPSPGGARGRDDLTVGPLTWQGLRALAAGDQSGRGAQNSGGWHYRVRSRVAGDAVVTVTVGAEQRARAGLEFGGVFGGAPAPAVTFHGCPDGPTTFVGSFFVAGDGRACVPLDVRVAGGPARHVVVSFFAGPCPVS